MSGATYDPISLMNEEKNHGREPSSSFSSDSTTPSHDDDIFSNATFAFSRYLFYAHDMEIIVLGLTKLLLVSTSRLHVYFYFQV